MAEEGCELLNECNNAGFSTAGLLRAFNIPLFIGTGHLTSTVHSHTAYGRQGKGRKGVFVGRRLVLKSCISVFCHHYFLPALRGLCWY